ncbi:MAG TPA: hypothetical protein ENK43_10790 [Planctomycetes bacterium]|nr:hypothetical protein [Planctomycetota bacterium]
MIGDIVTYSSGRGTVSFLGALFLALFVLSTPATAQKVNVKILDASKVYYPATIKKKSKFKAPAILSTAKVFDAIPEWKVIKKKKLGKKDAEYFILLKAANDKFAAALASVRKEGKFDIIAEDGAIECKGCEAEDVTQKMIDALPEEVDNQAS